MLHNKMIKLHDFKHLKNCSRILSPCNDSSFDNTSQSVTQLKLCPLREALCQAACGEALCMAAQGASSRQCRKRSKQAPKSHSHAFT